MTTFTGTTGDDTFGGTFHHDTYLLGAGGNDTANGGFGNDLFVLGDALSTLDVLTGGDGFDELDLDGDSIISFGATTIPRSSGFRSLLVTSMN